MPKRKAPNASRANRVRRRLFRRTRKYRRRIPRKNLVRAPRTVSMAPLLQEKVRTWLTYCDTKTITPATGVARHNFRLNSIYDPDVTGVGHQPAYMDQWATFYDKYRVIGCKYTVTFRTGMQEADVLDQAFEASGVTANTMVALRQDWRDRHILFLETSPDTTFEFTEATDKNFLRETGGKMSGVQWKYGPGPRGTRFSGYANIKDIMVPVSGFEVDENTLFTTNPVYGAYLSVGAMSKTGDDVNAVGFDIKLQFLVEFSDAKNIGES